MKIAIGLLLSFGIGAACRLMEIPLPAPPVLIGALLVLSMTIGYVLTGKLTPNRACELHDHSGGPSGAARGIRP